MHRELLTVRQTHAEYGLPRDYLYGLIRDGKLPVLGTGRRFLIPRRVIEDLLDGMVEQARHARQNNTENPGMA